MQLSIVVHEVRKLPSFKQNWVKAGLLIDGINKLAFLGSAATRIFSLENYRLAGRARLWTLTDGEGLTSDAGNAFLVQISRNRLLLVLTREAENISATSLDAARRPGVESTRASLASMGLEPIASDRIYSVAIASPDGSLTTAGASDGWLVVDARKADSYQWFGTYVFVALGVAIERMLINGAIRKGIPGVFRWLSAPYKLGQIRDWPGLPTIDKTLLAEEYLELRDSLHFRELRQSAIEDLEHDSRNLALLSAAVFGVAGIFATFLTQTTNSNS